MLGRGRFSLLVGLVILFSCGGGHQPDAFDPGNGSEFNPGGGNSGNNGGQTGTLTITWSGEKTIGSGGYGRAHRLNDGRLMLMFFSGGGVKSCYSSDNGVSWTTPVQKFSRLSITGPVAGSASGENATVNVGIDNPEFAQLPANHPAHPGRIIFATNLRPAEAKTSIFPYSIGIATSDDAGTTWTGIRYAYQSDRWIGNVGKGCWEPFVLVLPDGRVQIYFSDETPYWRNGNAFQNISVIESTDGGETWGNARIVAYTAKYRDGMPVLMLHGGNIYLAIEHNAAGQKLHPQIVYSTVEDNWSTVRYGDSPYRFDPFKEDIQAATVYTGAPYLIKTDNYFVLSYQSSKGSSVATHEHSVMEVVACPLSEFSDGKFTTMRGTTRPFVVDQTSQAGLWNSLCDLGDDCILAVSQVGGKIRVNRGRIQ